MDSHVLVAKAPPRWKARSAPHVDVMGTRPIFDTQFYVRYFSKWFGSTRRTPALSHEQLNECVAMLATAAPGQNGPEPVYKLEPAIEGVSPPKHHWFVHVDIPPHKPQEGLTTRQRAHVPREVQLFELLFSDLQRPPCDGEQGYSAYSFITSDSFIEDYITSTQAWFHLEDMAGQGALNVIKAMGRAHQWWCNHRRLTTVERFRSPPSQDLEASRLLHLHHVQQKAPPSQKEAHYVYGQLRYVRNRGDNESLRSYVAELMPWVIERSWVLYQIEVSVREDCEEVPILNLRDHEKISSKQPSLLVRHLLWKIAREGKDQDFLDWLSAYEIPEQLGSHPASYVEYPKSADPELRDEGTKSERFVEAVKRTLLELRCLEKFSNTRDLIELVGDETEVAYSYQYEEGETVKAWTLRLINQVRAPTLTIDSSLLVEEQGKGVRRCLKGYFAVLTEKLSRVRMRELYRYLVLFTPTYKGMAAHLETNTKVALADTMSRTITTPKQFISVLTDTDSWLKDMGYLQEPFPRQPSADREDGDGGTVGGRGGNAARRRTTRQLANLNVLGSQASPTDEAEPSPHTEPRTDSALNSLGQALKESLAPLASASSGVSDLLKALGSINATCGSLSNDLQEVKAGLRLHHEQAAHDANRKLNALDAHPSSARDHETADSALMMLQRNYPPRFGSAPTTSSTQGGPRQGRGGYTNRLTEIDSSTLADMPQSERPWPFFHPITDYYAVYNSERVQMEKETGITGPTHPDWLQLDVKKLPGQKCGCCGSPYHTNGWCDSYWAQQDKVQKEKGDLFVENRRQRLVWNKPRPAQISALSDMIKGAPTAADGVACLVNHAELSPLIAAHPALLGACQEVSRDNGNQLYRLLAEWDDPRTTA